MTYDAGNKQLNINTATYEYDLNGNRIKKTENGIVTTYTYDDENRLRQVTRGGTTISYVYDPFGRRIEKNVNGVITRYVYDNEDIILECTTGGTVLARYTHGPGIDEPFAVQQGTSLYYYHADGLGSIAALSNASGATAQYYRYDAFGRMTQSGSVTQPYMYTAREYDSETGMYFYRARYYDPKVGRFVTKDPIGFEGGDVNLYAYVGNDPLNWVDPSGLLCVYSQRTGNLTCTNDSTGQQYLSCNGYSGRGAGLNNPAAQNQPNVGPLPRGDYTVGAPNNRRGPVTRPLTPNPNNNMFGRSGFLIHGDNPAQNNTASEGCVIAPRDCRSRIPNGETLRVVQ